MKIAVAANQAGKELKEVIKCKLQGDQAEVIDLSNDDIFEATMAVVEAIKSKTADRGIVIDDYGVAPFMIASKNHGIICAPVYEDYTSKMTRAHNSTQMICLGAELTTSALSCDFALNFVKSEYDGGRHQVRVDMLDRML